MVNRSRRNEGGRGVQSVPSESAGTRPCQTAAVTVGIGASAGGLDALRKIFTAIPADSGGVYIVVMHLEPSHQSHLDQILARETAMPVCMAEEGMPANPNRVFISPPQHSLTLVDGRLHLQKLPAEERIRRTIDRLFESLAPLGERGVAVVLSGTGSDGTIGVCAVKQAGGKVLAQSEASAAFPDMPRSAIASGMVDEVLLPEEIATALVDLVRSPQPGTPLLPPDSDGYAQLDTILRLVRAKAGHDFSPYKTNMVLRRIERRRSVTGCQDLVAYSDLLRADSQEAHQLAREMLIGVTSFFRDPEAFAALRSEIFPQLFFHRNRQDPVRIWHAGCSTGEEAYSMAILAREFLAEQSLDATVQIFATDIDAAAVSLARAGRYPAAINVDISPERLQEYFVKTDDGYQVTKALREMIVFAPHSLLKDPPFSRLDLLVCRNFLIYLKADMQQQLFPLFHLALKPGGILFLGASETVRPASEMFELIDTHWKIYRRLQSKRRTATTFPLLTSYAKFAAAAVPPRPASGEPLAADLVDRLLRERYVPPCVVVNERGEVVHFPTTRTGKYLEAPVGEPTRDILKLVSEELRPILRSAIHKALNEPGPVRFAGLRCGDTREAVDLTVEAIEGQRLVLVLFEQPAIPEAVISFGSNGELPGNAEAKDVMIRQLEEQLHVTHEQLQATIEQLETANEGLMSTNEELLSINEEFQSTNEELHSTNEELETSREELQALNEELVTVNAELQQKVEELNKANSDMDNLLISAEVATIFLDRQLRIKRFTPAMAELFHLIPSDCNRPFCHLSGPVDWSDMVREMEQVLAGQPVVDREVSTHDGNRTFFARTLPYRTPAGETDGVVVTLFDITERKRLEARTRHLASFPEINPNPVMEAGLDGTISYFNPAIGAILRTAGLDDRDATPLLPADFSQLLHEWDRTTESSIQREVVVGERTFAATVHLVPQLGMVRFYAYDISERKRANQELVQSEAKYRRALDTMLEGCQIIGFDWRYLYLNDAAEEHNRRPRAELLGNTVMESWPGITETLVFKLEQSCMEERTSHSLENEFIFPDGYSGWFRLIIQPVDEGIAIYSEDISERKRASLALAESEARYRELVQNANSAIIRWKRDGTIAFCNEFAQSFFGYQQEEIVGRSVHLIVPEQPSDGTDLSGLVQDIIAHPDLYQNNLNENICRDGRRVWMNWTNRPILDDNGQIVEILAIGNDVTEQVQAEQGLRESEERLHLFIEHAPAALAMFDREMRYICASNHWLTEYGLADREITGLSHYDVFPEITDAWKEAHRRGLAGEVLRVEADRFRSADGSDMWLQWEIRPWYSSPGNVGGIVIFTVDITGRVRNEQRLELLGDTASRLLRTDSPQELVEELCHNVMTLLDCQAFFNFLVDEPSGRLHLNACAGIPDEERQKIEWLDYGVAVCGCVARDACRIVAEDIAELDDPRTVLVKSYGITAYACHPLMINGKVLGTLSFGTRSRNCFTEDDLTLMKAVTDHVAIAMERKLSNQSLKEQEEVYSAIVNNAADGIVLVDPSSKGFVEFNDAACASLGYSREEFATLTLPEIHDCETAAEIDKSFSAGELDQIQLMQDHQHRHKNGKLRDVMVNSRFVTVKRSRYLLSIWHDITDRKQIEAEREKFGRLESLGLLAGGIAHDFNNILTGVVGNISLARCRMTEGHPAVPQLAASEKALERAATLTRQLLTFARGGEPVKQTINTEELLREVISFSLHGSSCKATLDLAPGLWPLHADAGQLHQALNNLLINSAQAMPGGGVIAISASNEKESDADLPRQLGRHVKITIMDHGCGIPAENLAKIFDPYFTTKPSGSGLGLSSAFSIVRRHSGYLDVQSQPGVGTTIIIRLPATAGAAPAAVLTHQPLPEAATAGMSVLVMDDEEMIRTLSEVLLKELGYVPVTCSDGAEAVDLYADALKQGSPFSAVILDMTIPGGMGGRDAALKIRSLDADATLIISTGYSVDTAFAGEADPIFNGSVSKPYNLERMANELYRLTGKSAG